MNTVLNRMQSFSAAEEFLTFLGIEFDAQVVHVNRLHILKRFQQYLGRTPAPEGIDEAAALSHYKGLMQRAHDDFVKSDAVTEKVFKVFKDAAGIQQFSLDKLRESARSA